MLYQVVRSINTRNEFSDVSYNDDAIRITITNNNSSIGIHKLFVIFIALNIEISISLFPEIFKFNIKLFIIS